jgi:dolichol-phosphate mannosyltransferase
VAEVPIVFEDRRVGQSKMSRRIVLEALRKVWVIRFSRFGPKASGPRNPPLPPPAVE